MKKNLKIEGIQYVPSSMTTKIGKLQIRIRTSFSKRDKNLWIFGEWFGERCCDNAMAFANYVVQNHPEIHVVWIAKKKTDLSALHSKIQFVEMDTDESVKMLKRAGAAFVVQGLCDLSTDDCNYFGNALFVNLWHGVAWKMIGYDAQKKRSMLQNIENHMRSWLLGADFYLAPSKQNGKVMCSAYGLSSRRLLLGGYPRNAIFYDQDLLKATREKALRIILRLINLPSLENVRIIAYMPTFRDHDDETFSFVQLENDHSFMELLAHENAVIIQKAHFIAEKRGESKEGTEGSRILSINNLSAQELLAAADMLVTDYSSCFFDFLLKDKPIIHYLYDYDYYRAQDRGLYYAKEEVVCGDIAETIDELKVLIKENLHNPDKNKDLRKKRREDFMTYENAHACQTIFEKIRERQG